MKKYNVSAKVEFRFSLCVKAKDRDEAIKIARKAIYENGYCPMSPVIQNQFNMPRVVDWEIETHGQAKLG